MAEPDTMTVSPPRMKILFICGAGVVSGREIATLNLIAGLRERGHEVRCVASTWGDGHFQRRLEAMKVEHISLPLGFISKTPSWSAVKMSVDQLRYVPRLWQGYRRYVREFGPDVVVQSNFHHIFLLWPVLDAGKTFFHVHDSFPQTGFYRRLFSLFDRRIVGFIGVSQYIAATIVQLGIAPAKVSAVYNGVVTGDSAHKDDAQGEDAQDKDEQGLVRVGIVGQVGAWKGHDDLIEAVRELHAAGVPFSCTIFGAGDTAYLSALEAKITRYHLREQISHVGFVSDPRDIYGAVDICVVPSRVHEAFGMVAAEAAHFGVPVIATRRGAQSEIVQDEETGFIIDAESPRQLARQLRLLIENADLREQMGKAARKFAAGKFTRASMARQMEIVFAHSSV